MANEPALGKSPRADAAGELLAPFGGALTSLMVDTATALELKGHSRDFLSWDLTPRQLCDLELLLNDGCDGRSLLRQDSAPPAARGLSPAGRTLPCPFEPAPSFSSDLPRRARIRFLK